MAPHILSSAGTAAWAQRNAPSVFTGSYYGHLAGRGGPHPASPFSVPCSSCGSDTFWVRRENFIFAFATLLATALISETLHQVKFRSIRRRRHPALPPDEYSEFSSGSQSESSSVSYMRTVGARRERRRRSQSKSDSEVDLRERRHRSRRAEPFRVTLVPARTSEETGVHRVHESNSAGKSRHFMELTLSNYGPSQKSKLRRLQNRSQFFRMLEHVAGLPVTRRRTKRLEVNRAAQKKMWSQPFMTVGFVLNEDVESRKGAPATINAVDVNMHPAKLQSSGTHALAKLQSPASKYMQKIASVRSNVGRQGGVTNERATPSTTRIVGNGTALPSTAEQRAAQNYPPHAGGEAAAGYECHDKQGLDTSAIRLPPNQASSSDRLQRKMKAGVNQTQEVHGSACAPAYTAASRSSRRKGVGRRPTFRSSEVKKQQSRGPGFATTGGDGSGRLHTKGLTAAFAKLRKARARRKRHKRLCLSEGKREQQLREVSLTSQPLYVAVLLSLYWRILKARRLLLGQISRLIRRDEAQNES